ncbi:Crp/Fnr family transcriptional regulator [Mangrovicoccus algicola]|uniref:Crp/Fnr family transcriptional regulator n=1 Tax=Mangrovicoccus algicola TaxID=2771008 RepID=A0A8J6YZ12_9RHOB|nr:Crp/Fnr family transcriptional regulator [Mangrovicoccus algicola]MBE3638408.1 Crp/Fnr family transcriptional regulator [Mangrovicoccus algicola]
MPVNCRNCPIRRRDCFLPMSDSEIEAMGRFKSGELTVGPRSSILMEGSNSPQLFTVLEGQGLRYKVLENGRRQVISFVFPGDFLGLQAGVMSEMKHSVESATSMRLCVFERANLWSFFRDHPERAFDLTWLAAVEEHFLGEKVLSLGQRSATERIAWAFLRVWERLGALGLRTNGAVPFPHRQQDLADALGLSLVHTNKTLARLRQLQVAGWSDGWLSVFDPGTLADLALADPGEAVPRRPLL